MRTKNLPKSVLHDQSYLIVLKQVIEWFSFECRKTKTKVITLANHIGHRQYIEPIKTRSNYMWLTQSAGKSCERVTILALVLLLIGWKGGANLLSQSHRVESAKPITFRHSNENRSKICCIFNFFFPSSPSWLFELASRVITQTILDMWRFCWNSDDLKENTPRKRKVATEWLNITSWHNLFFELHISSTEKKIVRILVFITRLSNEVKPALGL